MLQYEAQMKKSKQKQYVEPEEQMPSKVTIPGLLTRKNTGTKILCLTAYDFPTARLIDEAGFDVLLVGDSMANVVLGHASTLKISLEQIISATRAVKRAVDRPLVIADMPFGSYQISNEDTIFNALRLVREGGAQAVKIEGARTERIEAIVKADIPVIAHLGLLPQSVNIQGGYKTQGTTLSSAKQLLQDALAIEKAGASALVLEAVPEIVATKITEQLTIPTIGIGAGGGCDGQILVFHDVVGYSMLPAPRFVKTYANLANEVRRALGELKRDMQTGAFPEEQHTYASKEKLPENWDKL